MLRESFGRSQGQVRPLGTSAGVGRRAAVEVWLAERVAETEPEPAWVWLPVEEAVRLAGAPALRDATTLAALLLAVRSGLPEDAAGAWSAEPRAQGEHPFQLPRPRPARPRRRGSRGERRGRAAEWGLAPDTLLNRELSELAFNERVLALAQDAAHTRCWSACASSPSWAPTSTSSS